MFSDHDDTLAPNALYEIVKELNDYPETDVVYTDEDKVTMDGKRYYDPHFKPNFNLDMLRCNNYICHIFVVKREIVDQVGLLRKEYDGAQDFDFVLRCCEKAHRIGHVAKFCTIGETIRHLQQEIRRVKCMLTRQEELLYRRIMTDWESGQR